jgi:CitMHS family citrate-Mg2+:H+ or citrate-Ca2+:H+ symporter
MVPSLLAGMVVVMVFAWTLGLHERKRLAGAKPEFWAAGGNAAAGGSVLAGAGGGSVASGARTAARSGGSGSGAAGGSVAVLDAPGDGGQADAGMAGSALDPNRPTLRPKLFWFNLALTVAVMVVLVLDVIPLAYVFMIGAALALVVNFPRVKDQAAQLVAHGQSIVAVVSMVMAAGVLTGVLNGTGMVDAMSKWLVGIIPESMGPFMAVITGLLSIPMTFFMSNDAFYFGVLPVLSETAAHFGIDPAEMARASITGQPVHMQSPLVPAILLLVSLAKVELGDHHKKVLWRSAVVALVMLTVGVLLGAIPWG